MKINIIVLFLCDLLVTIEMEDAINILLWMEAKGKTVRSFMQSFLVGPTIFPH